MEESKWNYGGKINNWNRANMRKHLDWVKKTWGCKSLRRGKMVQGECHSCRKLVSQRTELLVSETFQLLDFLCCSKRFCGFIQSKEEICEKLVWVKQVLHWMFCDLNYRQHEGALEDLEKDGEAIF